ncbi:MAG: DUF819 family protein, partial [Bacteroidota bacterium]
MEDAHTFFTNDAVVLGILILSLAFVFVTSQYKTPFWKNLYTFLPPVLLCYFIPAAWNTMGLISGENSQLYFVASRYLLPASLVLFTLSIDLQSIRNLGGKALIMFFTATVGIVLGGPVALWIAATFFPEIFAAPVEELWGGLATVAGSWIGGGANQAAMKEVYEVSDTVFASMILVDVTVANIWMGFLLFGAQRNDRLDRWLKADSSAIDVLVKKVEDYRASVMKIPDTTDVFKMLAVAFGATAVAHFGADRIIPLLQPFAETLDDIGLNSLLSGFFWLIVIATTLGVALSFTPARKLEGVGASRWGSVFIYILVATIGAKIDLADIFNNLGLFAIGLIWMAIHVTLLLVVANLI